MVGRSTRGKNVGRGRSTAPIVFPPFVAAANAGLVGRLGPLESLFKDLCAAQTVVAQQKVLAKVRNGLQRAARATATAVAAALPEATDVPALLAAQDVDFAACTTLLIAIAVPEGSRKLRMVLLACADVLCREAAKVAPLRAAYDGAVESAVDAAVAGGLGDDLKLRCFSVSVCAIRARNCGLQRQWLTAVS